MFNKRRARFTMADFQPVALPGGSTFDESKGRDVLIDRPTIQRENTKRLKIDKQETIKEFRDINEIEDKEADKKNAVLKVENFDSLKSKFLTMKNKALFIKRNKNVIKSLKPDHQKEFILLAKEHL